MRAPHPGKKVRAVALPVENQNEATKMGICRQRLLIRLIGNLVEQPWHDVVLDHLDKSGIDRLFDQKKRAADGIVDPINGPLLQLFIMSTFIDPLL